MLNRPYAFLQWINQARIPEKYVLMSEPDHIWLKPMPNLMRGQRWVGGAAGGRMPCRAGARGQQPALSSLPYLKRILQLRPARALHVPH